MTSRFRSVASSTLAAVLACAAPALAQQAGESSDSTAEGRAKEKESAAEGSAPSAASLMAHRSVQDPNQPGRIVLEILIGALGGAIGSEVVSYITARFASGNMLAYVFSRVIGGGLAAPFFVTLVGALSQARGQLGPTFMAALIGTAIHAGVVLVSFFAGIGTVPVIREVGWLLWVASLAMPWVGGVVGAVMGYEGSHAKALQGAVPVARPLWIKGGGGVALAWAI